jgi:predicted secreted Zn-dependent protease
MWKCALAGVAVACLLGTTVDAKSNYPTRYNYYMISGATAVDVFNSLSRRGPVVNGVSTYAFTTVPKQSGAAVQTGQSCRMQNFDFRSEFVINLPKLENDAALFGPSRKNWRSFVSFLKRHEEVHRSIALNCGRQLQQDVAGIRAPDCGSVMRITDRMVAAMRKTCQRQHNALDARDQRVFGRQPFIVEVNRGNRRVAQN